MEKGEEEDVRWKSGPFRSPSRPLDPDTSYCMLSMYKVYKEHNLDFPSRGSRIRGMEGWRDGGGGATLTVQADKKKNSRYPISMDDGVGLVN